MFQVHVHPNPTQSAHTICNSALKTSSLSPSFPPATSLEKGLPAEEVHRRALDARRILGKAHRALCFWLLEFEKRALFREFGCSSVYVYAERHLQLAPHTIAELLRTGHALETLPLIAQAFERGDISCSKIREISRVAVSATEQVWLDAARACTTREIEKMVAFTAKGELPFRKKARMTPVSYAQNAPVSIGRRSSVHPVEVPPATPPESIEAPKKCTAENTDEKNTAEETPVDTGRERGEQDHGEGEKGYGTHCTVRQHEGPHVEGEQGGEGVKYHDKLVIDLSGEQMAVIKDALDKARKESGLSDRASLFEYMARSYIAGTGIETPSEGKRTKPPYQILLHSHPASGMAWRESVNGARYIRSVTVEKALCDAEIIDLREEDAAMGDPSGGEGVPVKTEVISPALSNSEHELIKANVGECPTVGPSKEIHKQNTVTAAVEWVNALYAHYRQKDSSTCTGHDKKNGRGRTSSHNTIPRSLRKKVMFRDQFACQAPGCGSTLFISLHHIVPLAAGGTNEEMNALCLCTCAMILCTPESSLSREEHLRSSYGATEKECSSDSFKHRQAPFTCKFRTISKMARLRLKYLQ